MEKKSQGCCPSIHAKIFEIILIIGFILSIILLIVNLIISLWCFKCSYPLFIIEIGLIALNVFSVILSIILRIWRSDGSVYHKNFSSSNNVAIFNIILIIINLLASIAEEILFSFVISYLSLYLESLKAEMDIEKYNDNFFNNLDLGSNPEGFSLNDYFEFLEELSKKGEILEKKSEKKQKAFEKIMNKNYKEKLFHFDDDYKKNYDITIKKIKILKILPWIAINFNMFIQFLMLIFIIILIGRINGKSDFGFVQTKNNNQSVQNKMLYKKKQSNISGIKILNAESDNSKLEIKKKKKKKRK